MIKINQYLFIIQNSEFSSMTQLSVTLLLIISITILLSIDIFRRLKRKKYFRKTNESTMINKFNKKNQLYYPQLSKGIINYYIKAPHGYTFSGKDIESLFLSNGLQFNNKKKCFESLTQDHEIFFSIRADLPANGFNPKNDFMAANYTCLLFICKIKELSKNYDLNVCFEHYTRIVNKINICLGGILLNEHKFHLTNHDRTTYKKAIEKFVQYKEENN